VLLQLATRKRFWQSAVVVTLLACFSPATVGRRVWREVPTVRCLLEMLVTGSWAFPALAAPDGGDADGAGPPPGGSEEGDLWVRRRTAAAMWGDEAAAAAADGAAVQRAVEHVSRVLMDENTRLSITAQASALSHYRPRGRRQFLPW
jgi:hypothetical protein